MIIKMAIADENEEYVERLMGVLEGYSDLSLSVYTEKAALKNALNIKRFDILLSAPSMYDAPEKKENVALVVMLFDGAEELPESCRELPKIHKYQRISRIYQQVLELCADICGDEGGVIGQGGVVSVAFYSPVGGVGKTTLALAAATRLAMQGSRTLYLNLEDIPSDGCYLPQNGEKGMSEAALYLGENINFTMKVQGLLQSKAEGLYYLNHFDSPNDLCEMTGEELAQLVSQMGRTGLFDVIVIDMGVSMDGKLLKLFEEADRIVLVERAEDAAVEKLNCFLAQAHIINEYAGKMSRLLNFDMGRGSALSTEIPLAGRINAVQNPGAAQLIAMLAGDACCSYISQLAGRG